MVKLSLETMIHAILIAEKCQEYLMIQLSEISFHAF